MRVTNVASDLKLEDIVVQFLLFKRAEGVSERTLKDYEYYLNKFLSDSHNSVDYQILRCDTINYFAAIPDSSPARYNRPYANLHSFFNWAVAQGSIVENPIDSLKLHKKIDEGNIMPASIEDIKKLLNACDKKRYTGLRDYTIILLMLDTGIRTSELVRLKDYDFDRCAKSIKINKNIAKTRKERIAYLSDEVSSAICRFEKVKPAGWSDNLFPSREGKQLDTNELSREFRKLSVRAKVKITPYQLRHSFATLFLEQGGDLFTLQNLMGHSDLKMTQRYTEISRERCIVQHRDNTPINLLTACNRFEKI